LYIDDEVYVLWVGDQYSRTFYSNELPRIVRAKIAMILASPIKNLFTMEEINASNVYIYHNTQYPELDEVGWRVTDKLLCLVLPDKTIVSLQGELLTSKDEI